jgi:hypothetical protein
MPEKEHYSKGEEVERAAELRRKKERGEAGDERSSSRRGRAAGSSSALTREEAGFLGAVASRQSTAREEEDAQREGRGKEFEEEHRTKSWMAGEDTRAPEVSGETKREVERIKEKEQRGERLTHHEAGVLGGAARAEERSND